VGIVSLDPETPRASGDRMARSVAELHVEEVKLSLRLG
jgi:hypothetical protein